MGSKLITVEELRALRGRYQVKNKEISEQLGYDNGWGERFISKILNENEYASQNLLLSIKNAIIDIKESRHQAVAV